MGDSVTSIRQTNRVKTNDNGNLRASGGSVEATYTTATTYTTTTYQYGQTTTTTYTYQQETNTFTNTFTERIETTFGTQQNEGTIENFQFASRNNLSNPQNAYNWSKIGINAQAVRSGTYATGNFVARVEGSTQGGGISATASRQLNTGTNVTYFNVTATGAILTPSFAVGWDQGRGQSGSGGRLQISAAPGYAEGTYTTQYTTQTQIKNTNYNYNRTTQTNYNQNYGNTTITNQVSF